MDQPKGSGATKEGPFPGVNWADEVDYEVNRLRNLVDAAEYVFSRLKANTNLWGEGDIIEGLFVLMSDHAAKAQRASAALCGYDEVSNEQ